MTTRLARTTPSHWDSGIAKEIDKLTQRINKLGPAEELAVMLYEIVKSGSPTPEKDGVEIAKLMDTYFDKSLSGFIRDPKDPELSWFADSVGAPLHVVVYWPGNNVPQEWQLKALDRLIVLMRSAIEVASYKRHMAQHAFA